MRTFIVSDMHIGYEKSNYPKIGQFFDICRDEADRLVLNGDIFDLWRMGWKQIKDGHQDLVDMINQISDEMPVIYVRGNHDWRVPQKEFPKIEFRTVYEFSGISVTHGHRFDLSHRKYGWLYDWVCLFYPPLYQKYFRSPSEIIKVEDEPYWFDMHEEAMKYGIKHETNVIVGHSHSPQVVWSNKRFVADTGDWIDSCSYLIVEGDGVELNKI